MIKSSNYHTSFSFLDSFDFNLFDKVLFDQEFLQKERMKSLEYFRENSLPTPKVEEWKYFDLGKISKLDFSQSRKIKKEDKNLLINDLPNYGPRVVIINGEFCSNYSNISSLHGKVDFHNFLSSDMPIKQVNLNYIKESLSSNTDSLKSINLAFAKDIFVLVIKEGCILEQPIEFINISKSSGDNVCVNPRLIIISEEKSESTVIETCISYSKNYLWSNHVTDIVLQKNSKLKHCKFQNEGLKTFHTSKTKIKQLTASEYNYYLFNNGSLQSRNEINSELQGSNSVCDISGCYFISEDQHSDILVDVQHLASSCESNQKFYGAADCNAKGVFQGKIHVGEGTLNSKADQISRGIILSDDSQIFAKPELNILAEDVKCTHGVSIGELDEEAIFYLRSRGIPEKEAKEMLIYSFILDTLNEFNSKNIVKIFSELIEREISKKFVLS